MVELFNFKEKQPEFGTLSYDGKKIITKSPYEIFAKQKKSKGTILLDIKCSCGDLDCKNKIGFFYHGLNHYYGLKNLGSDTQVSIDHHHDTEKEKASNVLWNPTEENVLEFVDFSETVREAVSFKRELLKDLFARLQVRINVFDSEREIELIIRKDELSVIFYLFEIPNTFSNIPLLCEAKTYRECLGVVAILPADIDTSKIKNDYANIADPFFKPIIDWVQLLGNENQMEIELKNIWVMPE